MSDEPELVMRDRRPRPAPEMGGRDDEPVGTRFDPPTPRGAGELATAAGAHDMLAPFAMLPPTSPSLRSGDVRPYFLWWLDATVDEFRKELASGDPDKRAYFMGALLREANTRDVWLYVTPDEVRQMWDRIQRHLGTSRAMWAFLLGLPAPEPPPAQRP